MNVLFDNQIFEAQKHGGISRYFVELAMHLKQINNCNSKIFSLTDKNIYLDKLDTEIYLSSKNKRRQNPFFKNNQATLEKELNAFPENDTILHETYYLNKLNTKHRYVTTIHDMIYEKFNTNTEEEKFVLAKKKESILNSKHIICVSKSTKDDLLNYFPEAKGKISIVYHGMTPVLDSNVSAFKNEKPYILFVGNRNWYKNFFSLLSVYIQTKELHNDFDLICFGGSDFIDSEKKIIEAYQFQNKIKHYKGSDKDLHAIYKGASVLAYLSKYEGFGFPVLEAMQQKCPVICSSSSSLPEVAGNAACLIDTGNEQEILKSLNKILYNPILRQNLINEGTKQVKLFTWEKCALNTHEIYKQLISQN